MTISSLVGGVTAVGAALAAWNIAKDVFSSAVIGMNSSLEKAQIQFTNLLGSADAAQTHVRSLFRFAAETPFETEPILKASRLLLTFGGQALATAETLRLVGDAAAGTSTGIEEVAFWFGRAANAIQSGRPFGEAAARLQELGIVSGDARTRMEALQASGASAQTVMAALTGEFTRFTGQMQAQAGTWDGLVSTIKDGQLVIADALKPVFDLLKDVVKKLAKFAQSQEFADWAKQTRTDVQAVIDVLKTLRAPFAQLNQDLNDLTTVFGNSASIIGDLFVGAVVAAKAALVALATGGNPLEAYRAAAQEFKDEIAKSAAELRDSLARLDGATQQSGVAAEQAGHQYKVFTYEQNAAGAAAAEFTPKQLEAAKAVKEQIERLTKHAETLNLSGVALAEWHAQQALATTGSKDLAEQVRKAVLQDERAKDAKEAHTKATRDKAKADRDAATAAKKAADDIRDANLLINKLTQKKFELDQQEEKANAVSLAQLQEEIQQLKEEGQLLIAGLGPKAELLEIEKKIALARIDRTEATDLTRAAEDGLTAAEKASVEEKANVARANEQVIASNKKLAKSLDDALLATRDLREGFRDMIESLVDGDWSGAMDVLERKGKEMGIRLIEGIAFGKEGLENDVLIPNFESVFGQGGILGAILGRSGLNLGALFGDTFNQGVSGLWGKIGGAISTGASFFGIDLGSMLGASGLKLGGIFGSALGTGTASGWQTAVGGINGSGFSFGASPSGTFGGGAGASLLGGLLGAWGGNALAKALGLTASKEGKIGGMVGGTLGGIGGGIAAGALGGAAAGSVVPVIGTIIGAFIGAIAGAFGGNLFKPTTTSGTLIRKGVTEFLREIKATFASKVDSGTYFFEETKALAKSMFGGNFLEASKQILTDKAGPELAKELQAVGTFLTANAAKKLDKSVEQTGTTFGNLLIANLGIDQVPAALDEVVQKAGITFEALTNKLTALFGKERISAEFYKGSIEGAVSLFFGDLPEAIKVSELALKSFTEAGVFDLEKFQGLVEQAVQQMDALGSAMSQALAQGIASGQSRAEVEAAFANLFKNTLRAALIQKFITDEMEKLFEGIDLTQPIDLSSEAFATLKGRVGDAYDRLLLLLDAAGLLPDSLEASVSSADALVQKIRELQSAIQAIANERIEIRLQLLDDLVSIGFLGALDAIAARIESIQDRIDAIMGRRDTLMGGGQSVQDFINALGGGGQSVQDFINALTGSGQSVQDFINALTGSGQSVQDFINALTGGGQSVQDFINALTGGGQSVQDFINALTGSGQSVQDFINALTGSGQSVQDFINALTGSGRSVQDFIKALRTGGGRGARSLGDLSDADLTQLIQLQEQLRQAILSRYQQEAAAIQAAAQAQIAAIREEYAAKRSAIQEAISKLQEQRTATQQLYQKQIDALNEQLRVAEAFRGVVESINDMIRAATLSPQSPLDPQQQLGFLQREAAAIRAKLAGATGAERARLMQDLAQILQQQLSFVDRNTVNGQQLFSNIIKELTALRDAAAKEADKAAELQRQIAAATLAMDAALKSIDAQIAAQQKLLADLSAQEAAAIAAVEATAKAQLEALRAETAQQLIDLARKTDEAKVEQLRRLEAQLATAKEQLVSAVGAEEAAKLLAAGDQAHLVIQGQQLATLHSIDQHIIDAFNSFNSKNNSAGPANNAGATHLLSGPRGTTNTAPGASSSALSLSFSPVINVMVAPGEEGRVKTDLEEVMRLAELRMMRKLETDWAPRIKRIAEGKI
jgi:hypothetical protein